MTVRFSPSLVSNDRCFRRPCTMTREPRVSDSATFSAACRHTLQRRNSASPSFHSCDWRSKVRGVDATVKLATAAPEGVKRSSGSSVRLPTTVMMVSPAMRSPCGFPVGSVQVTVSTAVGPPRWAPSLPEAPTVGSGHPQARVRLGVPRPIGSVDVGADDLGPEDRLVQRELAVELLDGVRLGVEGHHGVDALLVLP